MNEENPMNSPDSTGGASNPNQVPAGGDQEIERVGAWAKFTVWFNSLTPLQKALLATIAFVVLAGVAIILVMVLSGNSPSDSNKTLAVTGVTTTSSTMPLLPSSSSVTSTSTTTSTTTTTTMAPTTAPPTTEPPTTPAPTAPPETMSPETVPPTQAAPVKTTPATVESVNCTSVSPNSSERKLFSLLNQTRAANGKSALGLNGCLSNTSRQWSGQMKNNGGISHGANLEGVCAAALPAWSAVGENVGMSRNNSLDAAVQSINTNLNNSPIHFANITGNFDYVGVGTVEVNQSNGQATVWATFQFCAG